MKHSPSPHVCLFRILELPVIFSFKVHWFSIFAYSKMYYTPQLNLTDLLNFNNLDFLSASLFVYYYISFCRRRPCSTNGLKYTYIFVAVFVCRIRSSWIKNFINISVNIIKFVCAQKKQFCLSSFNRIFIYTRR